MIAEVWSRAGMFLVSVLKKLVRKELVFAGIIINILSN